MSLGKIYIDSVIKRFVSYKELGDKTFVQLTDEEMHYASNEASNSVAVIIQHMSGNMLSRWTNFLNEDGEKPWRNRDTEFNEKSFSKNELLEQWEKGWQCLLEALQSLQENDLTKTIYVRKEPLTVIDAINRQLAHYSSHVGQIMYVGKMIKGDTWQSLSIPKGASGDYNKNMGMK